MAVNEVKDQIPMQRIFHELVGNTTELLRICAIDTGIHYHKIWRWYNGHTRKINSDDAVKLLTFLNKYRNEHRPMYTIEDLI